MRNSEGESAGWSAEGSPSAGSQDGVEEAAGRSFGGGWGGPPPPTGDRGDREGMDSRTGDREGLDSRRRGDLVRDLFGDLFMVARSPLSPRCPGAALYPGILCCMYVMHDMYHVHRRGGYHPKFIYVRS